MNRIKSEADARVIIDRQLEILGWTNIWRETVPQSYQSRLGGAKPDYVLCYADSEQPVAIIEAKRARKDLAEALKQGLNYAHKIECPVVFASDGMLTLTAHCQDGKPLMVNNEEVRDFLSEKDLRNFTHARIWERADVIKNSRQLITIFNTASKLLRAEGMVNIDAFAEFSQILFFKIISELKESGPKRNHGIKWSNLVNCQGTHLLESYKAALTALDKEYPEVFSTQVEIKNPLTLEKIITQLNAYSFLEIKADIKGNAYEHFLRQYNRQKNELAQYFTPRHIVAMMVKLADPKFGERVYDPFCGTGGMLIEAFRHLQTRLPRPLNKELSILKNDSVFGADISRSAAAAKMNMILAGDGHSNISRTDSLQSPSAGQYDVVITNIPFVATDEKAFVRHCLNACAGRAGGRVCIIVPERVLDHADYTDLRKELVHQWTIKRVISLPREVFRGITSAKTSVLYALWKGQRESRKSYFIPYIKIQNDGYTLDKKRDPLPGKNDLDRVIETRATMINGDPKHYASEQNNYAFKAYLHKKIFGNQYPLVPLAAVVAVNHDVINITSDMMCREPGMTGKDHRITLKEERIGYNVQVKKRKLIRPGDLVFAKMHTQNGLFAYSQEIFHSAGTHLVCTVDETKIDRDFLFYVLDKIIPTLSKEDTTGRENYSEDEILRLAIPLPPLAEQQAMVKNIKTAQRNYAQANAAMAHAKGEFWHQLK